MTRGLARQALYAYTFRELPRRYVGAETARHGVPRHSDRYFLRIRDSTPIRATRGPFVRATDADKDCWREYRYGHKDEVDKKGGPGYSRRKTSDWRPSYRDVELLVNIKNRGTVRPILSELRLQQ
jgi:hypothetical protein